MHRNLRHLHRRLLLRGLTALLALPALAWARSAHAESLPPFRVAAGVLPPFAIETGEGAPGALVEVVEQLLLTTKGAGKIEFFPWQRAVLMPLSVSRVAVLPLTRTAEREAQYRWLVKLYHQDFVFVARRESGFKLNATDSLKDKRVAVLRGSPHLKYLQERGFTHVFDATSTEEMHRMLERGIAELLFGGEAINKATIHLIGAREASYDFSAPLATGDIWLAGSPDFSEHDSAVLQAGMRGLIASGAYARILRKYRLGD